MWHRGRQRFAYCTVILLISTNIYVTDAISPQIMYIELLPKYDIDVYLTYQLRHKRNYKAFSHTG